MWSIIHLSIQLAIIAAATAGGRSSADSNDPQGSTRNAQSNSVAAKQYVNAIRRVVFYSNDASQSNR